MLHKSHIYVYDISYVSAHWCKYHISLPTDETVYEQYPVETLHAKHVNLHLLLPQIDGSNQTRLQRGSTSYSTNFLPLVWYNDFRWWHGPLTRYVKLRVANALGMPGTFSTPMWFSDPSMHHGTCVTHVPWCMPGSLTGDFHWSRWRGKRSRHSRRMRNPQFCVSGKRPIARVQISRVWDRFHKADCEQMCLH